jgi:hypothetical protein
VGPVAVAPPMAASTGNGNVGPTGLKSAIATGGFNQCRHPNRFRTGGTPLPRCGSGKRLSVYPKHQPRRGGIVVAGAARPRGLMEKNSLLSQQVATATGNGNVGPPGLKRPIATPGSKKIARHLGFTWAGRRCDDVGLVNDSLFTQNTSPGGAA